MAVLADKKPPIKPPSKPSKRAVSFAERQTPSLPNEFALLAAVDVDADGDEDLFGVIGDVRYRLTLLINGAGGLLEEAHRLPGVIHLLQHGVAVGDVDGDGDKDVVVAQTENDKGRLLLNDGKGHFVDGSAGLPAPLKAPRSTVAVALADFDRDGHLDLFQGTGYSTFFPRGAPPADVLNFGDGKGKFVGRKVEFSPSSTNRVLVSDINADGKLDVIRGFVGNCDTSCDAGAVPGIMLGDGKGGFNGILSSARSYWCTFLHAADLNGDSHMDVLAAGHWFAKHPINDQLMGSAKTAFKRVSFPAGRGTFRFAADIDRDGDDDVFVSYLEGQEQGSWWVNDGKGKFTESGERHFDITGLADLDSDGDVDMVGRAAYYNDGRGKFSTGGVDAPRIPDPWRSATLTDVDGDAHADILAVDSRSSVLYWNDGRRSFLAHDFGHGITRLMAGAVGDIDHDGDLDVFGHAQMKTSDHLVWLEQTRPRVFKLRWTSTSLPKTTDFGVLLDLDGDKDLDAIQGTFDTLQAWRNDQGKFVPVPAVPKNVVAHCLHVVDVNADGRDDLYVVKETGPDSLWLGSSTGIMTDASRQLGGTYSETSYVESGDLNGDGAVDLVLGTRTRGAALRILLNQGKGVFGDATAALLPKVSGATRNIDLADIDEDGDHDLIRTTADRLQFFMNTGNKFTEDTALSRTLRNGASLLAGDIDGDLDADVLLSGQARFLLRNEQRDLTTRTPPLAGRSWQLDFAINPRAAGIGRFVIPYLGAAASQRALRIPGLGSWSLPAGAIQGPALTVSVAGRASMNLPIPPSLLGAKLSVQGLMIHAVGAKRVHFSNAIERQVLK